MSWKWSRRRYKHWDKAVSFIKWVGRWEPSHRASSVQRRICLSYTIGKVWILIRPSAHISDGEMPGAGVSTSDTDGRGRHVFWSPGRMGGPHTHGFVFLVELDTSVWKSSPLMGSFGSWPASSGKDGAVHAWGFEDHTSVFPWGTKSAVDHSKWVGMAVCQQNCIFGHWNVNVTWFACVSKYLTI